MDNPSDRKQPHQFDQAVLDLYDDFAHGRLTRRDYVKRLAAFAVGGMTVETLEQSLAPNYAWAEQVPANDSRIKAETITYESPTGGGAISGLLARPSTGDKFPAVLVIHENRGLNPYIADVARRVWPWMDSWHWPPMHCLRWADIPATMTMGGRCRGNAIAMR